MQVPAMSQPEHRNCQASDEAFVQQLYAYEEAVEAGRIREADSIACNIIAPMFQEASDNPTPELLLEIEAERCLAAADWEGAKAIYRKLLDRIAASDGLESHGSRYAAFSRLSGLLGLLGDETAALEQARSATAAAREADMPILLGMALEQQSRCALHLGMTSDALRAVDEALRVLGSDRKYDIIRGSCLVLRAELALKAADAVAAGRDLEAARQDLEKRAAVEWAGGARSAMARWYAVKAGLQAKQGDWDAAARTWTKAMAARRHLADLPHTVGLYTQNALAATLWSYGQALRSAGCQAEAEGPLAESRGIRKRIGLPQFANTGPA